MEIKTTNRRPQTRHADDGLFLYTEGGIGKRLKSPVLFDLLVRPSD